MDARALYPKDIIKEEDILIPIFFSRTQDETWEEFCKQFASERYNSFIQKKNEEFEKNLKAGFIID